MFRVLGCERRCGVLGSQVFARWCLAVTSTHPKSQKNRCCHVFSVYLCAIHQEVKYFAQIGKYPQLLKKQDNFGMPLGFSPDHGTGVPSPTSAAGTRLIIFSHLPASGAENSRHISCCWSPQPATISQINIIRNCISPSCPAVSSVKKTQQFVKVEPCASRVCLFYLAAGWSRSRLSVRS